MLRLQEEGTMVSLVGTYDTHFWRPDLTKPVGRVHDCLIIAPFTNLVWLVVFAALSSCKDLEHYI